MRVFITVLFVSMLVNSNAYGQSGKIPFRILDPFRGISSESDSDEQPPQRIQPLTQVAERKAPSSAIGSSIVRSQFIQQATPIDNSSFLPAEGFAVQDMTYNNPGIVQPYAVSDPTSAFNYPQPAVRRHLNPDQFWTRKQQPIVETRNPALFGKTANEACDEWAGYCKCCGFKGEPGRWGIRWLGHKNPLPCSCVECGGLGKRCTKRHGDCTQCQEGSCSTENCGAGSQSFFKRGLLGW